jgi:hypothetical protein
MEKTWKKEIGAHYYSIRSMLPVGIEVYLKF